MGNKNQKIQNRPSPGHFHKSIYWVSPKIQIRRGSKSLRGLVFIAANWLGGRILKGSGLGGLFWWGEGYSFLAFWDKKVISSNWWPYRCIQNTHISTAHLDRRQRLRHKPPMADTPGVERCSQRVPMQLAGDGAEEGDLWEKGNETSWPAQERVTPQKIQKYCHKNASKCKKIEK